MHSQFKAIYADLIRSYREPESDKARDRFSMEMFNRARDIVVRAVDAAKESLPPGKHLRADGEYYLITALHQMVVHPLLQEDSPTLLDKALDEQIAADAISMALAAAELDDSRDDVPASFVLWGAARVLPNLNLKSWRIWDRDE